MIHRRQVWLASLPKKSPEREQVGTRPVLVLSTDELNNSKSDILVAIPLTRTDLPLASRIRVEPPEGGLKDASFIQCEQIRSISKKRLIKPLGSVGMNTMAKVDQVVYYLLDFSP